VNLAVTLTGWDDLNCWADRGPGDLQEVRAMLEDVGRTPFEGTGRPEPPKCQLGTVWSRRITQEHRLVYAVEAD